MAQTIPRALASALLSALIVACGTDPTSTAAPSRHSESRRTIDSGYRTPRRVRRSRRSSPAMRRALQRRRRSSHQALRSRLSSRHASMESLMSRSMTR